MNLFYPQIVDNCKLRYTNLNFIRVFLDVRRGLNLKLMRENLYNVTLTTLSL